VFSSEEIDEAIAKEKEKELTKFKNQEGKALLFIHRKTFEFTVRNEELEKDEQLDVTLEAKNLALLDGNYSTNVDIIKFE